MGVVILKEMIGMTKAKKVILCTDSNPQSRKWTDYAVDSLERYSQDTIKIYVISDSLYCHGNAHFIDINQYANKYRIKDLEKKSTKYFDGKPFPYMTYARLIIPLLKEFEDDDCVVYLDSDTEVVDSKFFSIFSIDAQGNDILGVVDKRSHFNRSKLLLSTKDITETISLSKRNMLEHGEYINAGVLYISLKNIKAKHKRYWSEITNTLDIIQRNGLFNDQDTINVYFDIGLISEAFNSVYKQPTMCDSIYLYHYLGADKCGPDYPPVKAKEALDDERDKKNRYSLLNGYDHIWDVFDGIYVICCIKYADRVKRLIPELTRIGCIGRIELSWDFKNPFYDKLKECLPLGKHQAKHFYCGFNHYRAIKEAYLLGKEAILVIEDDVRFLKDIGQLKKIISSIPCPCDYDLIMFDKNWPRPMTVQEFVSYQKREKDHEYIYRFDKLYSSGCYSLSKEGMRKWLKAYEDGAFTNGRQFLANDQYFNKDAMGRDSKLYCTIPNVAVQIPVGQYGSATQLDTYWNNNEICGSKQETYFMEIPIVNRLNFHTLLDKKLDSNKTNDANLS